jgi:hypothetical protein
LALVLVAFPHLVFAQVTGRNETKLTVPVGGDILPGSQALQGGIGESIIFRKLIPFAIKYTIRLTVALAVVALIVGGYQFMTSYGDDEKRQGAQKTIIYALIGLILAILAFGIVSIITSLSFVADAS